MAIGYSSSQKSQDPAWANPVWARWIVPSVGDLIFVALLGVLVFTTLSVRLLGDAGIGWHIRTGQIILATHSVPRTDPFSSTMAGQRWFAWEWLYDMLAGGLDTAAGLNGVVLLTALIIACTFSLAFFLLLRRGTNFMVALILTLLAASASTIHFLARPHVLSWLFTILWFSILEPPEVDPSRSVSQSQGQGKLWTLPLLMVLWVNLHGGFLVGLVLLGIFWLGALWQWLGLKEVHLEDIVEKAKAGRKVRDLSAVGIASALATLVNPYGWHLHVHIYSYLSNRFLMDHIDEFKSPNFHDVPQKCFAILLVLGFLAFAANQKASHRLHTTQILIVLFALYSGLYASRNLPVSSLLLVLVIGPILSRSVLEVIEPTNLRQPTPPSEESSGPFLQRMQRVEMSRCGHLWPLIVLGVASWITFHGGMLGRIRLMDAHFSAEQFPVNAVDYLEKLDFPGPILAPDAWGGYFIYRLYPDRKVVVDDRHDLYGEPFLKEYLSFIHLEPDWTQFLEQHPAGCVVVPTNSAVATMLGVNSGWKLAYSDRVAHIYLRLNSSKR
jgi:hypothetical protein